MSIIKSIYRAIVPKHIRYSIYEMRNRGKTEANELHNASINLENRKTSAVIFQEENEGYMISYHENIEQSELELAFCLGETGNRTYRIHDRHMTCMGRKRNYSLCTDIRSSQLELLAYEINDKKIPGSVAEVGVAFGDFAKLINESFPERKLYLFDTFEGFSEKDTKLETIKGFSEAAANKSYDNCTTDIVLKKMPYPERCVFKKGWFPDSAEGVEDKFCFVSLDTDLYKPIYAGLSYFYPRLSEGGYIIIHDYASKHWRGVMSAVREYCAEQNISYTPICDAQGSVVITK